MIAVAFGAVGAALLALNLFVWWALLARVRSAALSGRAGRVRPRR